MTLTIQTTEGLIEKPYFLEFEHFGETWVVHHKYVIDPLKHTGHLSVSEKSTGLLLCVTDAKYTEYEKAKDYAINVLNAAGEVAVKGAVSVARSADADRQNVSAGATSDAPAKHRGRPRSVNRNDRPGSTGSTDVGPELGNGGT